MARGFESKQVEFQQEEAARGRQTKPGMTAEEKVRRERRQSLQLARSRATADLSRATVDGHRRMLEQAIASLDAQLADVGD
jgi:hypothetical protein